MTNHALGRWEMLLWKSVSHNTPELAKKSFINLNATTSRKAGILHVQGEAFRGFWILRGMLRKSQKSLFLNITIKLTLGALKDEE